MCGCTNATHINKNVNYFKFQSRVGIKSMWMKICKKDNISDNAVVCSLHFKNSDIIQKGGKTCLLKSAVPVSFDSDVDAGKFFEVPPSNFHDILLNPERLVYLILGLYKLMNT